MMLPYQVYINQLTDKFVILALKRLSCFLSLTPVLSNSKFLPLLTHAAQKLSVFRVIPVRIFRHSIFQYSARMREDTDQNNSQYGHISRSVIKWVINWNVSLTEIKVYIRVHVKEIYCNRSKFNSDSLVETMPPSILK